MGKLSMRDFVHPGTRVGPAEDLQVCFNLLVDIFPFTIGLRMIGSGEGEVVVQEFPQFLGKDRGKL